MEFVVVVVVEQFGGLTGPIVADRPSWQALKTLIMSVPCAIVRLLAFVTHVGKDTARPHTRSTREQKG